MSVRLSLLAMLDQGPCYGSQLRTEYSRRTGAPLLNIGQIYTTLERLERDGLVVRRGADDRGHVYWGITAAGSAEAALWFRAPEARDARDGLAHKIALLATLPGVDAASALAAQRVAASARLGALAAEPAPADLHAAIVAEAERAHARADLAWLDAVSAALTAAETRVFPLSEERPRRGRPVRSDDPA